MIIIFATIASFAMFIPSSSAQNSVIIKNGETITSYRVRFSDKSLSQITINKYEANDATLQLLNIPEDSWPLFQKNNHLIFSVETLETTLDLQKTQTDLDYANNEIQNLRTNTIWKNLTIIFLVMVIIALSLALDTKNKKIKVLETNNA